MLNWKLTRDGFELLRVTFERVPISIIIHEDFAKGMFQMFEDLSVKQRVDELYKNPPTNNLSGNNKYLVLKPKKQKEKPKITIRKEPLIRKTRRRIRR